MKELLVVLGALVSLVLSIAGMNIYRRRADVLTGPYILNRNHQQTIPDNRIDELKGQQREKGAPGALPAGMKFGSADPDACRRIFFLATKSELAAVARPIAKSG
jgi:hypothetical protein